jgi:GNAT superfamily N-acetyltransferase
MYLDLDGWAPRARLAGAGWRPSTGCSVLPEARGRGIAGALTDILIAQAADLGCRRVVLDSSALAAGSTPAPGFTPCCDLAVHATAAIWSAGH